MNNSIIYFNEKTGKVYTQEEINQMSISGFTKEVKIAPLGSTVDRGYIVLPKEDKSVIAPDKNIIYFNEKTGRVYTPYEINQMAIHGFPSEVKLAPLGSREENGYLVLPNNASFAQRTNPYEQLPQEKNEKLNQTNQREEIIRKARRKSCPETKKSTKNVTKKSNKRSPRWVALALLCASISASTIGVQNVANDIIDTINLNKTAQSMSEILVKPGAKITPDIINRNTYRTDDYQGFWFDNQGIAEDLLSLPPQMFEAALYVTYCQMGIHRQNAYINNWDKVILSLNNLTTGSEHTLVKGKVSGCQTFNDYLVKNGFVDENNLPLESKFIEYGKKVLDLYSSYIENYAKEREVEEYGYNYSGR